MNKQSLACVHIKMDMVQVVVVIEELTIINLRSALYFALIYEN